MEHDVDDRTSAHLPVTVYWQRRAVIGLLVMVLVGGLWFATVSWRGRTAVGAEPPSASTSQSPQQSVTASPTPSAASSTPGTPTSTTDPAEITCDVAQLVLRLSGPARVKAGSDANLVTTFTNVGTDACKLPLTTSTFLLAITSGSDQIWKSTDCAGWSPDSATVLQPGQTLEWTMAWNRHRSDKCTVVSGDLRPGTYVATASWRDGPSARLVMTLTW